MSKSAFSFDFLETNILDMESRSFWENVLTWPLTEKWFWMLVIGLTLALVLPLLIAWVIFSLPPFAMVVALVLLFFLWVAVRSYLSWSSSKRKDRQKPE